MAAEINRFCLKQSQGMLHLLSFFFFLIVAVKNAVPLFRSLKKRQCGWCQSASSQEFCQICHRGDGILKLKQVSFIRNNITTQMYFLADPV